MTAVDDFDALDITAPIRRARRRWIVDMGLTLAAIGLSFVAGGLLAPLFAPEPTVVEMHHDGGQCKAE